jgi:uncharacterized protein YaaN involved in tellurite resistance
MTKKGKSGSATNMLSIIPKNNTVNLSVLSKEEKAKYLQKMEQFNGENIGDITQFGKNIAKKISDNSSSFFEHCKVDNAGEIGDLLTELQVQLEIIDPNEIKSLPNKIFVKLQELPLIGKFFRKLNKTLKKYDTISESLTKISDQIVAGKLKLSGDNNSLQRMYDNDKRTISELEEMIIGGKLQLQNLQGRLDEMNKNPDDYNDHDIFNLTEYINLFDKRVTDWLVARHVLQNGLTEKRAIQYGNIKLMNNSETICGITIPILKNSLANSIALFNQKKVLESHKAISKATNDTIKANASNIRTQMKEINTENQNSIVSLEALKSSTNDILNMLIETKEINNNAITKRRELETKLMELNTKISNSSGLISNNQPSDANFSKW